MPLLLWLAALSLFPSTARAAQAAAPAETPAYVTRGRQTETRQRAYHDRIERFYTALSEALRQAAPDLLPKLAAPPAPDVHGYQILPKMVADGAPAPPGTKSQVVSYSWGWSDTLIARQTATIERLEAELAEVPLRAAHPSKSSPRTTGASSPIAGQSTRTSSTTGSGRSASLAIARSSTA